MTNNDVFRNIQQVLGLNESTIVNIFELAEYPIDKTTVSNFLKNENETGYTECIDNYLTLFLNGLITYRRGKGEQNQVQRNQTFPPLTNNSIYKKLKIAFDLKEDDLLELMSLADYPISKNELSAISRKPGHKHYRACSDEFLASLLNGLTFRQWN